MENTKPEIVEKNSDILKTESDKAETKLRAFERNEVEISVQQELKIDDLRPNSAYEKNGYTYETDKLARPVRVSGYLRLEKGTRTPHQTEIGKLGKPGDEGGHIVGTQFDGPSDAFNIRPQDKALNHREYTNLENEWVNALKSKKNVQVEIEPHYADNSVRPDRYVINYWIDGIQTTARLKNQATQHRS